MSFGSGLESRSALRAPFNAVAGGEHPAWVNEDAAAPVLHFGKAAQLQANGNLKICICAFGIRSVTGNNQIEGYLKNEETFI